MWLFIELTHTENTIFVYILYKYNSSLWIHFKYMIYMISHLISQYHRIAILNAIKIYKIQLGMHFFFLFYLTQNFTIRMFLDTSPNTFCIRLEYNLGSPAYVQAMMQSTSEWIPRFCSIQRAVSNTRLVPHSTRYHKAHFSDWNKSRLVDKSWICSGNICTSKNSFCKCTWIHCGGWCKSLLLTN